jgi:A/G-specific adenine glycosylase
VIRHQNKILMKERGPKDIWQGLYDFYLIEKTRPQKIENLLAESNLPSSHLPLVVSKTIKHVLSHQQLIARFIQVDVKSKRAFNLLTKSLGLKAFSVEEINRLPKPVLIDRYLNQL